jgi:hypothetical protein
VEATGPPKDFGWVNFVGLGHDERHDLMVAKVSSEIKISIWGVCTGDGMQRILKNDQDLSLIMVWKKSLFQLFV